MIISHRGLEYKLGRFGRVMVRYVDDGDWVSSTMEPGEFARLVKQQQRCN